MKHEELFVFAGAGASFSAPSGLPLFADVRDHLLKELGLSEYVIGDADQLSAKRRVAEGLVPEPFLSALDDVGVPVEEWFGSALASPKPNAVHFALAEIAMRGGRVWTVNFDQSIERAPAGAVLQIAAWPSPPSPSAQLHKPHGTVGGPLIVTADHVLAGLDEAWEDRLRSDVCGRTVVFIGYRARDLDFRALWDDVLAESREVLWFDFPATSGDAERQYQNRLLVNTKAAGKLTFIEAKPSGPNGELNPSWDFVTWAERMQLVAVPEPLKKELWTSPRRSSLPEISVADLSTTVGRLLEMLGDVHGARARYLGSLCKGQSRAGAARQLLNLSINHGARPTATVLGITRHAIPPIGRLDAVGERLRRKHLSILFNLGSHTAVLRQTQRLGPQAVSTLLTLRSGSLRMIGDLDEAVDVASEALRRAQSERHRTRAANAAFQLGMALMWAGRLDEAWIALHDTVRPRAEMAASRWVAWADFLEAALLIHRGDGAEADLKLEVASARFGAELLMDGVVSVHLVQLTLCRLLGDSVRFAETRDRVRGVLADRSGTYYSRGHEFTSEALLLEEAEFRRSGGKIHTDVATAFSRVAKSRYPLHASSGFVGSAAVLIEASRLEDAAEALRQAQTVAESVNARVILLRTADLRLAMTSPGVRPRTWYHP